ncbi:Vacuolar membrane protein [Colletotrichum truncatum]|uniref:Vacuolar membrane protein n=1 Tax=Colletotrichum truncatum TaxID=5467 RepID=A0ACC3ZI20_COLTU|nr:Vacuolar membrane protein [Colletotrichum truncatum]KAF6785581.1 Vacuolar membrane protein [Colletotrichum truncatum]
MAPSRTSLKRTLLLSSFAALSLFSVTGLAQDNNNSNTGGNAATSAQQTSQAAATTNPRTTEAAPPTRTTQNQVSITNTGKVETTAESFSAPRITGGSQETEGDILTGFPSLTNAPLVTTYPPPAVPPTNNAPFMHRSSAPQGTVFIAVGAILGAFGLGILIWRGIVACLLHRSVARAANAQHVANDKASFPAPPAQFYKYTDRESTPSLVPNGRGVRRTQRGPIPSATPSQSNLFFSPTAAGGGNNNRDSVRDSRFLPSGFYAAGASSPSHAHGHGHSISLTNLRPDSRGQYGGMPSRNTMRESTPPESPSFGARRDFSTSSVSLSQPPGNGQRAPSAYLENLLDETPSAFPPTHMRPGSRNANNSPGGRM